jgi:beta-alanine degradation protein BauB
MPDIYGLDEAERRGMPLGEVGQRIVLENEHVRIWEVRLEPGETIDFHIHYHPYIVISLGGGENEIETIFGKKISIQEPLGSTVFIDDMRPVHRLSNRSNVTYLSRLIELKHIRWSAEPTTQAAS